MVTPFDRSLNVDYEGLEQNIEFQIKNGVSGLSPLGTTGEAPTITDEERRQIIETVVSKVNKRVPVIVGTGSNSTEHTIRYTKEARDLGADYALIVTPYYNRPSQEGIYRHFEAITKAVDIPIMVYNIAGRTGVNIETNTMVRIGKLNNIVGVKEASGNVSQIMDVIHQMPGSTILSGDDGLTLSTMAHGGQGVVSVVSNLFPKRISDMVRSAMSGRMDEARRMHFELLPIFRAAFVETNPVPIKTAMRWAGMPAGGTRLPLCEMQPNNSETLKNVLLKYDDLKIRA